MVNENMNKHISREEREQLDKNASRMKRTKLSQFTSFIVLMLIGLCFLNLIFEASALPAGPTIIYVTNSTAVTNLTNRSNDAKGTITTLRMDLNQQDYKWKAYVGNVSGKLALDDANSKSIYDWTLGTPSGKVFATRASTINWNSVGCVGSSVITSEQTALGMTASSIDNINSTFNFTIHRSFLVGVINISQSSCRSTATYINDAAQTITVNSPFQEVLLNDSSNSLIYTTLISSATVGYNGLPYDFQMIVGENESGTSHIPYYFYVELGS